jgi:CheY-like chemotaxis protein
MARILIADDDDASLDVMATALSVEGHQVVVAVDGKQALEMTVSEKPDLIFLDIMMPKFDGYETCKRIREHPDVPDEVPIIFLTSVETSVEEAKAVGASDRLAKRHMVSDLQEMLAKYL